ncbi:MAG: hypothetical protein ACR2Q3_01635 [Woeseiaceae bacterium]
MSLNYRIIDDNLKTVANLESALDAAALCKYRYYKRVLYLGRVVYTRPRNGAVKTFTGILAEIRERRVLIYARAEAERQRVARS